jgi:hypothetical protein
MHDGHALPYEKGVLKLPKAKAGEYIVWALDLGFVLDKDGREVRDIDTFLRGLSAKASKQQEATPELAAQAGQDGGDEPHREGLQGSDAGTPAEDSGTA